MAMFGQVYTETTSADFVNECYAGVVSVSGDTTLLINGVSTTLLEGVPVKICVDSIDAVAGVFLFGMDATDNGIGMYNIHTGQRIN